MLEDKTANNVIERYHRIVMGDQNQLKAERGGGVSTERAYIEFANYHEIELIRMDCLIYAVGSISKVSITEASYDVPDWAKNCTFTTMDYHASAYHKVVLEISNTGVITLHDNSAEGEDALPGGQVVYFNTGYYNQYIEERT